MIFTYRVDDEIELRLLEDRDAGELFALVEGNRERLRRWLPWVDRTHSPEAIREYIRKARQDFAAEEAMHLGVWYRGRIAGGIGYRPINPDDRSTSVGYWLDGALEGKGIVTRCVAAVLDYLFGERNLHRAEIRCAVDNVRSCAVPERLGFTREGVARDAQWVNDGFLSLVVWSMLAPDWKARQPLQ